MTVMTSKKTEMSLLHFLAMSIVCFESSKVNLLLVVLDNVFAGLLLKPKYFALKAGVNMNLSEVLRGLKKE